MSNNEMNDFAVQANEKIKKLNDIIKHIVSLMQVDGRAYIVPIERDMPHTELWKGFLMTKELANAQVWVEEQLIENFDDLTPIELKVLKQLVLKMEIKKDE